MSSDRDRSPLQSPIKYAVTRSISSEKAIGLFGKLPESTRPRSRGSSAPRRGQIATGVDTRSASATSRSGSSVPSGAESSRESLDWINQDLRLESQRSRGRQRTRRTQVESDESGEDLFFTPDAELPPPRQNLRETVLKRRLRTAETDRDILEDPDSPQVPSPPKVSRVVLFPEAGPDLGHILEGVQQLLEPAADNNGGEMADQVIQHKTVIATAIAHYEDSLATYVMEEIPLDFLKDELRIANDLKLKMTTAMAGLSVLDAANYTGEYKANAILFKNNIAKFVYDGQIFVKRHNDQVGAEASAAAVVKETAAANALKIKSDRVVKSQETIKISYEILLNEMNTIIREGAVGDRAVEALEQTYRLTEKEVNELIKEVTSVYSDAVTAGMNEAASLLDETRQSLKEKRNTTEKALLELKVQHGLETRTSATRARLKDIKPPLFNGSYGKDNLDFYTFKTEFNEYSAACNLSMEEQADLLKKACLSGTAKSIVVHMKKPEEIWRKLKETYGNPQLLINNKIKELEKLGKCPDHGEKKREWFVETSSKIDRLQDIAREHKQEQELYHSGLVGVVKHNLTVKDREALRDKVMEHDDGNEHEITKEELFNFIVEFLRNGIKNETFNLRFDNMSLKPDASGQGSKQTSPADPNPRGKRDTRKTYAATPAPPRQQTTKPAQRSKPPPKKKPAAAAAAGGQGGQARPQMKPQDQCEPKGIHCILCKEDHFHLFECRNFQSMSHEQRIGLAIFLKVCFRCLRNDSQVFRADLTGWFEDHLKNCNGEYQCMEGMCAPEPGRDAWRQRHIVMCEYHSETNKGKIKDFINTLDKSKSIPNLKFFFMDMGQYNNCTIDQVQETQILPDGTTILPDIINPSIYMVQTIPGAKGIDLQMFFDSGCSTASMNNRAYTVLSCEQVRPGPTYLNVAGGGVVKIDYGDERFCLDLATENETKATITALRMDHITSKFPHWKLKEAWDYLNDSYSASFPENEPLPLVDDAVGGVEIDLMLGIRYNQYFPKLKFMLPCGLAVYEAQFKSVSGNLGVLGGSHSSWKNAEVNSHFMGPMAYFTAEVRAHQSMVRALDFIGEFDDMYPAHERPADHLVTQEVEADQVYCPNVDFFYMPADPSPLKKIKEFSSKLSIIDDHIPNDQGRDKYWPDKTQLIDQPLLEARNNLYFGQTNISLIKDCSGDHCERHQGDDWLLPETWEDEKATYTILQDERLFEESEAAGSEVAYRCVSCRNCLKCKDGDHQEKLSLNEEVEEALIVKSLRLEVNTKKIWAELPFVKDPTTSLKPNRYLAEKIFDRQMKAIEKNPEMKDDILKSHAKLEDKGFVIKWTDIPVEYIPKLEKFGGPGYIIPWQIVYKPASRSTPVRMVMNGSCATPGGESLNGTLAKGANSLTRILDILISFRTKKCALMSDIKMAYNNLNLEPEFYKFQKYLWKEGLDIRNPTIMMCIITIIYGIKPSGQQTIAALRMLADYVLLHHPIHSKGAMAVKTKAYMDDIGVATNSQEESREIADSIDFTLDIGSMKVKDYTFSGSKPSDLVSTDGTFVGLLGYNWASEEDYIKVDIKDITFTKPKRGKTATPAEGNLADALRPYLTKRTLVSQCAKVFDPLGLLTPITAKLKLDLHEVSDLKVQWDEKLPEKFITPWVENLGIMQELKQCIFPRAIVPEDAANTDLEYVVSADASTNIAIAAVHGKFLRTNGEYSCSLLAAKSKLVKGASVPRAELKAAVLAASLFHIVKRNTLDQFKKVFFVSDSTITLYWISQDYRPLQITVRNSVIEIRRLSLPDQWFHISTDMNIADLGTRPASVEEISPGSEWIVGKPWMSLPHDEFMKKLKPIDKVTLENKDKVIAAKELKAPDVCGFFIDTTSDKVGLRYELSKYPVDPCAKPWPISVGILALVLRVVDIAKRRPVHNGRNPSEEEITRAQDFFFRLGTKEVEQFSKEKDWKNNSIKKDKILYSTDRVLEGRELNSLENIMLDLDPFTFVRPILDRYSPLAYSITVYCHVSRGHHHNAITTVRETMNIAHIIGARELATVVRENCHFCKRYKRKLMQVEFGKIHRNRVSIAPAFFYCQADICGPFMARCEHQSHRATVKVWGLIFKCTATCAVAAHVMTMYDADAFVLAYTRFAARYGHPKKLFIDQGSQLVKGCEDMNVDMIDLTTRLDSKYRVGIDYQTGPVGAHNTQGQVERSIKEIKKLFNAVYRGLGLEIMSYETAFSWIANELNCLPLFLGSKYRGLDHLDLLTPARLLLGRNNRRALSGCCTLNGPSKVMQYMDEVYEAWWEVWKKEKLTDFVPQPRKWKETTYQPVLGDVVLFKKDGSDKTVGTPRFRVGIITTLEPYSDKLTRKVIISYKNAEEETLRTTRRGVRELAILLKESDVEMVDMLNDASKKANMAFQASDREQGEIPWDWWSSSWTPPTRRAQGPADCADKEIY